MDPKVVIPLVLLDVAIVVVAARLAGHLFRRLGQPAVIGEIAAGIALGPTLLGLLPGDLDTVLFPPEVRGHLSVIAQLGLALFMFIVGLEIDVSLIKGRGRTAGVVAAGSMVLPFALGAGVALLLYPQHSVTARGPVSHAGFVLFLGVAMAITAMPVLARILTERRMQRTRVGVLALAAAVIDDVLGWSLLAVVVAVAAGGDVAGVARILGLTVVFALFAFLGLRPLLARLVDRYERAGTLTPDMLAIVLAGLLASAVVTEWIGIHAIFGAFIFGAIMPRSGAAGLTRAILERLEHVSLLLLLPVFFVVAGLGVNVAAIGLDGVWQLGVILVAAIVGKVVGATTAARTQRLPRREATTLGILMNTRGLTEIVILQVGLQLGLLDQTMYTLMVLMALITTAMTGPLVRIFYPPRVVDRELAAADRAAAGEQDAYTVVVAVPDERGPELADLAAMLVGHETPGRLVLTRLLPAPPPLEVGSGVSADLAAITQAGQELRQLAARVHGTGLGCSAIARFSGDPAADLAGLAATLHADVVVAVLDEPPAGSAPVTIPVTMPGHTSAVRVRLGPVPGEPGPVAVLTDGAAGGRAAVRLAAQLALGGGQVLGVTAGPGRRAERQATVAATELRRIGIPVQDVPAPRLLVVPAGAQVSTDTTAENATMLVVDPDEADRDDELEQVVGRITVQATTPRPTPSLSERQPEST